MFNHFNLFRITAILLSYMIWSSSKSIVLCDVSRKRTTLWIVHENQISKHSIYNAPSRWWRPWVWLDVHPVFQKYRSRWHSRSQSFRSSKIPAYIYKHSHPLATTMRHGHIIDGETPLSTGPTYRAITIKHKFAAKLQNLTDWCNV